MRKYLLAIFCTVFLLSGCNYLNMLPEKDIETVESVFEQYSLAEDWWKELYDHYISEVIPIRYNVYQTGSDELIPSLTLYNNDEIYKLPGLKVASGLQMSQDPIGDVWKTLYIIIRNGNTFLENIDKTHGATPEEIRFWKGDVKAFQAYLYFELVRRYGPICLVPENLPVNLDIENYKLPRLHVDTCFKEIIKLLDEAVKSAPPRNQMPRAYSFAFSKEAIYALKAKVLLYAASPFFNGNIFFSDFKDKEGKPYFSQTYDRNKWLLAAQAADEAADICVAGSHSLVKGNSSKKTKLLNSMSDVERSVYSFYDNPEFIIGWTASGGFFPYTLPRLEGDKVNYYSAATGSLSPSMKMVEMFYTDHGLPIDADFTWSYSNRYKLGSESDQGYEGVVQLNATVLNLHLRREPRFYSAIAGDRMYWQRGENVLTTDFNLLVKAYKGESWGTQLDIVTSNQWQNCNGYWLKKNTFSWIPTANYGSYLTDEPYPILRLAEVFLMQAEAWNEYLDQPDERVYGPLDRVRERAGILPVREAWQNYSNDPTRPNSQFGMRDIIQREYNLEFAFEGLRYWNLRRWLIAHQVMNEKQYGWNILGTNAQTFYNNEEGPVVVWTKNKFVAPRDYLQPIRAEEILISGMKQNPGW